MNSKEALKNICSKCEEEKWKNKVLCPFRSISSDYCEEYETIEKDLEVLEILKKSIKLNKYKYDNENKVKKHLFVFIAEIDKDYRVIKEWLDQ